MEKSVWDLNQASSSCKTSALACVAILVMMRKMVNFNEFQSFALGHIIWQATAIIDG